MMGETPEPSGSDVLNLRINAGKAKCVPGLESTRGDHWTIGDYVSILGLTMQPFVQRPRGWVISFPAKHQVKGTEQFSESPRSQRREARTISVIALEAEHGQPEPETLEWEAAVPQECEATLYGKEDFIEELLGG
ncbi:hypothetical protein GFB49_19615 [Epibacterium sp. SM1979]|uniref:Uncharacterized protein n=1 Tax=Tritonibacter litoralis TaxID=2662264 RepID=A0A843YHL5_9RHOB|nr:hypothetical protein [Tritonibacter litoralis]MQQ10666.1 hypothetical protein [Tritonibacter litoralis]